MPAPLGLIHGFGLALAGLAPPFPIFSCCNNGLCRWAALHRSCGCSCCVFVAAYSLESSPPGDRCWVLALPLLLMAYCRPCLGAQPPSGGLLCRPCAGARCPVAPKWLVPGGVEVAGVFGSASALRVSRATSSLTSASSALRSLRWRWLPGT